MRKKIHKNLVGIAALAIILTIGLTFWAYFMMLQKQIFQDLQTDVHVLASSDYIVDTLEQNYDANADGLRITLISKDGSVLYESKGNASKMENHMERPEVQQALKNGEGKATRRSNTIGTLSFYYAEKLDNGCIIRVSRDIPYVAKLSVYLIPEGIAIFAGIFVLCLILGHIMTKRFIEPIEMLAVDVEKVSEMQTYPEIQPFIETINQQHRELKRNSKMPQEFTANVSHELKTPLTSISGYAELIESGIAQGEDTVRFAGEIHKSSQRLLTLINDILRLSQLDSVEECVDTEPVDLYEMALNCQDMLEMQANKHQVVVRVKGRSEVVQANRRMMDELIYNLCDNAIRYNRVGGSVNVTIGEEAQHPFVSVKDTGIGVSKEDQERIFERFYRVDKSRSKQTGGTGLGLAIVKHIAVMHKAELKIESELGKGTEIKILFNA